MGLKSADDELPNKALNAILATIFSFEKNLVGWLPMPFGISIGAVLSRPK
jgi:hypothetical protein